MDFLRNQLDDFQEKQREREEKQKLTKLVEDATSECLMKPSDERNRVLCGYAGQRGDLLLSALRKRMEHNNPAVQYLTLRVLEHCIQNSNSTFHDDLVNDKAMQGLVVKAALAQEQHPTVLKVKDAAASIALDLSRTFEHDESLHRLGWMHREIMNSQPIRDQEMTAPRQQVPPSQPSQPTPSAPLRTDTEMIEMECGFCDVRLSFPVNARKVKCGRCQQINRVTRTVQCGSCHMLNEILLSMQQFGCGQCGAVNAVNAQAITTTVPRQQQPQPSNPRTASDPWECPQCTFVNPVTRMYQCAQCNYRRPLNSLPLPADQAVISPPTSSTPPPEPIVPWTCNTCTFVCTRNRNMCEMCGAPKYPPPPQQPPSVAQLPPAPTLPEEQNTLWICSNCTFSNGTATRACSMCAMERPQAATAALLPTPTAPTPLPLRPSQSQAQPSIWNCKMCTFENTGAFPVSCEMCGSARN